MAGCRRLSTPWTPRLVEAWLIEAHDVLRLLPDVEERYLRNALRSRMVECVENSAMVFAAQVGAISIGGVSETEDADPPPSAVAIGRMERVLLGGSNDTPWLKRLNEKQRRLVWRRISGMNWAAIAAVHDRSERTVQRWYADALEKLADELETVQIDEGI